MTFCPLGSSTSTFLGTLSSNAGGGDGFRSVRLSFTHEHGPARRLLAAGMCPLTLFQEGTRSYFATIAIGLPKLATHARTRTQIHIYPNPEPDPRLPEPGPRPTYPNPEPDPHTRTGTQTHIYSNPVNQFILFYLGIFRSLAVCLWGGRGGGKVSRGGDRVGDSAEYRAPVADGLRVSQDVSAADRRTPSHRRHHPGGDHQRWRQVLVFNLGLLIHLHNIK